jgi:NADPH-dependent 2,4-dienoyl-CoA reductase/sulfur reductase-like enzyme
MSDSRDGASSCDVLVVGGGAAGLAAAFGAADAGAHVVLVEREHHLGGILEQCIHNGFGLHRFKEELTGPEYAAREAGRVISCDDVRVLLDTTVLSVEGEGSAFRVTVVGPSVGLATLEPRSVVFACGCRERTRGAINIAGSRPSGVHTAGSAQRLVNCDGALVGRRVVILGSGDIGLIMARRMTWEGARVLMVCELAAEPGGLRRNIVQCLDDNDISLHLSTTVTRVFGHDRLEAVEIADVDPVTMTPVAGSQRRVECDTLLLSVGLIPENDVIAAAGARIDPATSGPEVSERLETSVEGIFVAGNELHVHDLVDFVSEEGELAGRAAAAHALGQMAAGPTEAIRVTCGEGVGSLTPQRVDDASAEVTLRLRVRRRMQDARIVVRSRGEVVKDASRRIVVPSEMQTVRLSAQQVASCAGTIEVSCETSEGEA